MFTPQKPQPPRTFGGVQNTFIYKFRNLSQINEQFTVVEDLPRNKPVRIAYREKKDKSGSYPVLLLRISNNNFEADLEMMEFEFDQLAIACPKDTPNMKGATFAFDGRKWQYVCGEMPTPRDPRQPDLNPPPQQPKDQKSIYINQLFEKIKTAKSFQIAATDSKVTAWAEEISPGNGFDLIKATKDAGLIVESQGIFRVIE